MVHYGGTTLECNNTVVHIALQRVMYLPAMILYYVTVVFQVITKRSLITTIMNERGNLQVTNNTTQYDNAMRNILTTMTTVVIMYAICWTPFETMSMLHGLGFVEMDYDHWIYVTTVQLMFSYSLINPLIYVVKYRDFRNAFAHLLRRLAASDNG